MSANRRRYKRPAGIIAVMRKGTDAQKAEGREILKTRYGFADQTIDLMLSRGAATGRAPIAGTRLALGIAQSLAPSLSTVRPPGAKEVLDLFFRGGRKGLR